MRFLLESYPEHALSLDVSTDNERALKFYNKVGLKIRDIYITQDDQVEFAFFETPLNQKGQKLGVNEKPVQNYFEDAKSFREYQERQESIMSQQDTKSSIASFDGDQEGQN